MTEGIPDAPNIPHFLFRRPNEQDFGQITDVINASWEADLIDARTNEERLAQTWRHPQNFDPTKDAVIVERDGVVVGYANVTWRQKPNNLRIYTHNVFLLPKYRTGNLREGMVRRNENRLRRIALGHPDGPKFFEVYANSKPNHWRSVLETEGYRATWFLFGMLRPDLQEIPDLPLPEGVEVRPVRQQDLRRIWDSAREAFRDGREFTEEKWSEQEFNRRNEASTFTPELWQIAWEGDEVVGGVHNHIDNEENQAFNRKWGHTEQIFVRRPWRNRGIAKALIARSLRILSEHGMTEATLDVDTENPSGALRLYENLGFKPYSEFVFYRKPVF